MNMRNSLLRGFAPALAALALAAVPVAANAASLIPTGFNGQIGYNTPGLALAGVTNQTGSVYAPTGGFAYNFIYSSLTNAVTGAAGSQGTVALDLPTGTLANASGGILALDSDYAPFTGQVTVSFATTVGDLETITFGYGGSQQFGFSGTSTDVISAYVNGSSAAADTEATGTVPSQGAVGFLTSKTFSFIASSATSTISFGATGTPTNNVPAFALVDNLQVTQTIPPAPEPNSLILLGTGLAGLGGLVRSRFVKAINKA